MTEPQVLACCSACRYSRPVWMDVNKAGEHTPTPILECHRHPPMMVPAPDGSDLMVVAWVQVDGSDWCGDYADD